MLARQLEEDYYEALPQEQPVQPQKHIRRRTVKRITPRSNGGLKVAMTVLLAAVMAVLFLGSSSELASRGFELVQLKQQAATLEKENAQLEIENAKLKSPNRIKEIAEKKLGMTIPHQVYFVEGKKN